MYKHGNCGQNNIAPGYIAERNEKMSTDKLKEELKKEIETKRNILNRMIAKGMNKEDILKFSQELDELIGKYHKLDLNIK